jgi:hypothetical protein
MRATTPTRIIMRDAELFISEHADGIEALGATRTRGLTYGLGCRTENADGESILPMFSREQMGNEVEDWTGEGDDE